MILREYIEHINKLVKVNPELLDAEVYTMSDDEGNERNEVNFLPSVSAFDSNGELVKPEPGDDSTIIVILN